MKVYLIAEGKRHAAQVAPNGEYVSVEELTCPHCNAKPLQTRGADCHIASDDRAYEAEAHCLHCKKVIGLIRTEVSTIFGLHEDEAVLSGRCRVY